MIRPNTYINWTDGDASKVIQPPSAYTLQGFVKSERPPFQYMNWALYKLDTWVQYLDENTTNSAELLELILNMKVITEADFQYNNSSGVLSFSDTISLALPGVSDIYNQIAAGSVTLADGQVAYTEVHIPVNTVGSLSLSSNLITLVQNNQGIQVGQLILGAHIPTGTTVVSISANIITMSNNALAASTNQAITFINGSALTLTVANNTDLIPDASTIVLARRAGSVVYLGANSDQMTLQSGEKKRFLSNGFVTQFQVTAGETIAANRAVYISLGTGDGGRTAGSIYQLDVSSANKATRSTYIGFTVAAVTSGGTAQVVTQGFIPGSFVAGTVYYADESSPGGVTSTAPILSGSLALELGVAISTGYLSTSTGGGGGGGGDSSSSGVNFVDEVPTGTLDGTNPTFTLSKTPKTDGSVRVSIDGILAYQAINYTISGSTITFLSGSIPNVPQKLTAQYVSTGQSPLAGIQEVPVGTINGTNATFTLAGNPPNQGGMTLYKNGIKVDSTEFSLIQLGGASTIVYNAGAIPTPPDNHYVDYFVNVSSFGSGGGGGGGGLLPYTSYVTLNSSQITAKQITLSPTPSSASSVILDVVGGTQQVFGSDFLVSGSVLSWSGLTLDGVLSAGDILRVFYLA